MLKQIDAEGEWWFPRNKDLIFNGKLTFSQEEGGSLVIYGSEDPFAILDTSNVKDSKDTLILGKLNNGSSVTLQSHVRPNQESILRKYYSFSRRTFKIDFIFIGHHFEDVQDIVFENISIEYSNIEKWLDFVCKDQVSGRYSLTRKKDNSGFELNFYDGEPLEIGIKGVCRLKLFSFPSIKMDFGAKTDVVQKLYVKFESHGNKSLHDYIALKTKLQNFFNFVTTYDVDVHRMVGEVRTKYMKYVSTEYVEVLYRSSISSKMDKIKVISPNLPIYDIDKVVDLIKRWFALSNKISAVYDLYFGVMYNYELYLTNKFLMLAEALEIYSQIKITQESKNLKNNEIIKAIKDVNDSKIPIDSKNWIKSMLTQKNAPSFRQKMSHVYDKYADLLPKLSKVVGSKEHFSNLVTEYRNKLTHGNINYDDLNNEELFWKYKDIQLILQLCILTELGYSNSELKTLYLIDK